MSGGLLGRRGARENAARGWTLLELLVVLGLIALLTAIGLGAGQRAIESSRISRARAELAALTQSLEEYRSAFGDYPRTDDLGGLLQALAGQRDPDGRVVAERSFLKITSVGGAETSPESSVATMLLDPWERPYRYIYRVPAAGWVNPRFVLYSIGPDGAEHPTLLAGGFVDANQPANADNIFANP